MIIVIGSTNINKINATKRAFSKVFHENEIKVIGLKVDSGVSPTPISDQELVIGAKNRALNAYNKYLKEKKAIPDFSVGIEGGVVKYDFGTFIRAWVAIYNGKIISFASTISLPIPQFIWQALKNDRTLELETIMEKITNIKNLGEKQGAIGFFTRGHYKLVNAFEHAIICALARFLRQELYENNKFVSIFQHIM